MATYSYSKKHRAFEIVAIITFVSFAVADTWLLVGALDGPSSLLVLIAAMGFGYILADFISGCVHWLADRYGTVDTPFFGPNFVEPFRTHHVRPKLMTEHDFIETNGNNCIVSFWTLVFGFFFLRPAHGELLMIFLLGTLVFSMVAIMATNQIHKWSHQDSPPLFARVLQRLHLILPPRHHDVHHKAPFETYFCITNGWLNWPLQKIRFFESMEWLIERVLGLKAGEDDAETVAAAHGKGSA
ncbi:MAG: fatty acid desaturase family protein [Planctomycetota bacterium]|jgi:ubiquitin-conjugating enzyme E2 variant